jgi:hypothetical protein
MVPAVQHPWTPSASSWVSKTMRGDLAPSAVAADGRVLWRQDTPCLHLELNQVGFDAAICKSLSPGRELSWYHQSGSVSRSTTAIAAHRRRDTRTSRRCSYDRYVTSACLRFDDCVTEASWFCWQACGYWGNPSGNISVKHGATSNRTRSGLHSE